MEGVVVQWRRVPEGRTWDTGTRGQHIVQSGRQLLVDLHTHFEGGADSSMGDFGPQIARDRLYLQLST